MQYNIKNLYIQYWLKEMQNFKGLIPRNLVSQEQLGTINRKTQQFRKITVQSSQITVSMLKIYEVYLSHLPRIMDLLLDDDPEVQPTFYTILKNIYTEIYKQYHNFILDYIQTPSNEMTNSNSLRYINFSGCILTFQKQMKNYYYAQNSTVQMGKKYLKSQKLLFTSIEAYKQSFAQAKLIYNMDEKLKRYSTCQQNFKNTAQDHATLTEAKQKLFQKKKQVIQTFQLVSKEMGLHQNQVNVKTFIFLSKFNTNICQNLKKRLSIAKQGRKRLQKIKIQNFFTGFVLQQNQETKNNSDNDEGGDNRRRKAGLTNLSNVSNVLKHQSPQTLQNLKRQINKLQKYIQFHKVQHLRVHQFHVQFFKTTEKKCILQLKQSLGNFEKNKKKIKQNLSQQCYQQLKSTLSIIKTTMDIYTESQKKIGAKITTASQLMEQLKNILQKLAQQVNGSIQKLPAQMKQKQTLQFPDFKQKIAFIKNSIKTTDDRISGILKNLKIVYTEILNIYELAINDSYDRCNQIGKQCCKNMEETITKIRDSKIERLRSTPYAELLNEQAKAPIVFDDDVEKNNDFKKLRKPVQIEVIEKEKQGALNPKQQMEREECMADDDRLDLSPMKIKKKHLQFIQSKISFVQGQELKRTFSCALADKIILQGRLYVTSHRVCFFSSFNPSNVFFGETFIQIPKKDIVTLEKRKNGIFFDNSISLTTVKGELFLTSFFKRNEAFKLLSQLIGINYEEQAYEHDNAFESDQSSSVTGSAQKKNHFVEQQKQQKIPSEECESDIKQQQISERSEQIQGMLKEINFNFKECASAQLIFKGLTAYKLLRIHLLEGEITISGKKYLNFNQYFKKVIQLHRDIEITPFTPAIGQHLNPGNIKSTCPVKMTRKVTSTVPTPNSSIPFVPKSTKTMETQKLYIVSKHRWVMDVQVENSGAPYTDSFKVYYRTTCDSTPESCKIVSNFYIHFIKNVMVKGIIQTKTQQQSKIQLSKQYQELRKYLITAEKQEKARKKKLQGQIDLIKVKSQNLQGVNRQDNGQQQQNERILQLERELSQKCQKYQLKVKQLEGKLKTYQVGLAILLILNVMAGIYLIF